MQVKLLRDSRIHHKAGEIVEVSPAEANYLLSMNFAARVAEPKPEPAAETQKAAPKKKATKK